MSVNYGSASIDRRVAPLQIDLLVAAMRCDVTRVGSIQFSDARNHVTFPFLDSRTDAHELSHNANDPLYRAETISIFSWYAEQFAYLLQKLKQTPEGSGTMLDNTLVFWCNEIAQGGHTQNDMPFVLAGRAGGAIRTGRYLQYNGKPHNDLLVSILNAMDVKVSTFGNPNFCNGRLAGL
jgi:hypothetical protein